MSDSEEKVESAHPASASYEGGPLSTVGGIAKTRIWRKLDIHLLPLPVLFYFLSFLSVIFIVHSNSRTYLN